VDLRAEQAIFVPFDLLEDGHPVGVTQCFGDAFECFITDHNANIHLFIEILRCFLSFFTGEVTGRVPRVKQDAGGSFRGKVKRKRLE
jgi:hypothetical protein